MYTYIGIGMLFFAMALSYGILIGKRYEMGPLALTAILIVVAWPAIFVIAIVMTVMSRRK